MVISEFWYFLISVFVLVFSTYWVARVEVLNRTTKTVFFALFFFLIFVGALHLTVTEETAVSKITGIIGENSIVIFSRSMIIVTLIVQIILLFRLVRLARKNKNPGSSEFRGSGDMA